MSASYCFVLHGRCIAPRVRDSIFAEHQRPQVAAFMECVDFMQPRWPSRISTFNSIFCRSFRFGTGESVGDIVLFAPSLVLESSGVTAHCWTSPQESDNFPWFVAVFAIPHRQSVPELCLQVLLGTFCITGTERKIHAKRKHDANRTTRRTRCLGVQVARTWT